MKITQKDLDAAAEAKVIAPEVATELWAWLEARQPKSSAGIHVLAYLGALVVISSLTWFATRAFGESDPTLLLATGVTYFLGFTVAGVLLRRQASLQVPSMLLLTIAVFMVPLTIYALQRLLGLSTIEDLGSYRDFYTWIKQGWFFMELGTIVVAVVYLALFRYEFLTFPLAFVLWFLSMDLTPLLFGVDFSWEERKQVSLVFGLIMLAVSYGLDLVRKERDYSFWLYLFGLLAFWCAVSFSSTDEILLKLLYCAMNLLLIAIAVVFRRPVFLVFGSLGVFLFLSDITNNVFGDSLFFPIVLSFIGLAILVGAIVLLRNQAKLEGYLTTKLPAPLRALIPGRSR